MKEAVSNVQGPAVEGGIVAVGAVALIQAARQLRSSSCVGADEATAAKTSCVSPSRPRSSRLAIQTQASRPASSSRRSATPGGPTASTPTRASTSELLAAGSTDRCR